MNNNITISHVDNGINWAAFGDKTSVSVSNKVSSISSDLTIYYGIHIHARSFMSTCNIICVHMGLIYDNVQNNYVDMQQTCNSSIMLA